MKTFAVILAVVATLAFGVEAEHKINPYLMQDLHREPPLPEQRSNRNLQIQFLDQRVDNFNPQNYATYQMAYFENDEFFAENGPLFIFIGGEWSIEPSRLLGGHIYDMAEEFNASLFYTEHRYYGRSFPTVDLSVDNLRFLSVEQALADLASFIVQIKRRQTRYANSDVILVGGSYSATMAVWFRQFYTHLAVGAWASSAPVLAKVDFEEYKEIVGAAVGSIGGRACYSRVENAFAAAEDLIADNRTEEFAQLFGFCEGFGSHPLDVASAFGSFSNVLAGAVQYHRNGYIEYVCANLMQETTTPSTDLAEFARYWRNQVGIRDDICLSNFDETLEYYRNTSIHSYAARSSSRQWMYQTCTEFGWYQTSSSEYQPFGSSFPVDLYYGYCSGIYGDRIDEEAIHNAIDRTNVVFGGWNLNVQNVYFTNGLVDPWRAMSIQEDLNESSPADVIPGASHCHDLESISALDTDEMRQVKERITGLVRLWLGL